MRIRLLKPLNYFEVIHLNQVFPAPPPQPINAPPKESPTADNSATYPAGKELIVEVDTERQKTETNAKTHWFRNDEHPGGFSINKGDYEKIAD